MGHIICFIDSGKDFQNWNPLAQALASRMECYENKKILTSNFQHQMSENSTYKMGKYLC